MGYINRVPRGRAADSLEWLNPTMTSNTTPSGYVASASTEHSGRDAYYAFKHNPGSPTEFWSATTEEESYLQLQFPSAVIVKRYALTSQNVGTDRTPITWTLKGSNNGSDWTTIDTVSGESEWTGGETRWYDVDSPGSYSYCRIYITANYGGVTYTAIAELQLWG